VILPVDFLLMLIGGCDGASSAIVTSNSSENCRCRSAARSFADETAAPENRVDAAYSATVRWEV
jgi:hypothetical protein